MAAPVSRLFAAVGSYSCGKTTTLRYLAEHYGHGVHEEAHNQVLAVLGQRMDGHPPDQGFTRIDDPVHFCPMCRPVEFCDMVLARQAAIETAAAPGDFVDHGWLDAVEYGCRNAGLVTLPANPARPRFAPYALVFLFAVVPEAQRSRWGKPVEQRITECEAINRRLAAMYRSHGMTVVEVAADSVERRAARIHAAVEALRRESGLKLGG